MFRIEVKELNGMEVLAVDLLTSLHAPAHASNTHILLLKLVNLGAPESATQTANAVWAYR